MLVRVADREHKGDGSLYPQFIDSLNAGGSLPQRCHASALCVIPIFWSAYDQIFPESRHRCVGKKSGKTNLIERFNCTLRQRVFRLVRKTLSFSKKLENHIGAI